MATFLGLAWLDLAPGSDVGALLDLVRARQPGPHAPELYARVSHDRLLLSCDDGGYEAVADLTVDLMRATPEVGHAFVALNHDEYGAEHAVLARRDGEPGVVQQVIVYPRLLSGLPYRGYGPPWQPDLPVLVRSSGSRWWGRLVDGPESWSAISEAYGVPVETVREAARRARHAYQDLQVPLGPFEPWLDALGILRWNTTAGWRVKLWPGPVWTEAVIRYALPRLPERWLVRDDDLIMEPVGLVAGGVRRAGPGLGVLLQPLYLPVDGPDRDWLVVTDCPVPGVWERFATVEEGEPYMDRLVEVVHRTVLPFLDRYCSPEGYLARCRRIDPDDPHTLHRRAATEIVLRRYEEAAETLADLDRHAADSPGRSGWLADLAGRARALRDRLANDPDAARETLLAGTGEQRRRLGLPI